MSGSRSENNIRRKPVPIRTTTSQYAETPQVMTPISRAITTQSGDLSLVQTPVSVSTQGYSSYDSSISDDYAKVNEQQMAQLSLADSPPAAVSDPPEHDGIRPAPMLLQPLEQIDGNVPASSQKSSKSLPLAAGQAIRSGYQEVRHFAGGLISHPTESTKHYSILRHSHGLIYYTGSHTNVAITVFADRELPEDRSFWLQRKGFSGKTGMRAGVLFRTHGSWVNVTPSATATVETLNSGDERAWQRDIKKFLRKAPKKLAQHQVRETNILRIPCEADDGYLRVVMCAGEKGKKYLCPSPVFRLASTSMSSSSIRGASLRTLPVEAAIKFGTIAAQTTARTFVGPYVETARGLVTSQVTSVYQPSAVAQTIATTAYDQSGVTEKVDIMNQEYEQAREASHQKFEQDAYDALARPVVIGDEDGPSRPYPVRFHGNVVQGRGHSMSTVGVPTANVVNVDSDILLRHKGIYFGWAAISLPKKLREELLVDDDWHEAIISIIPDPDSMANVVQKKVVRAYIIEDFDGAKFFDAKISIMLMGFIRPAPEAIPGHELDIEAGMADLHRDIVAATASLSRAAWRADETIERVRSAASARSITERYVDMRQNTQKQIDKVPTWKLGVRTDGAALKDRLVGNGGFTILR